MSELRERIGIALALRFGNATYEDADAIIAALGDVEEHVEYRVVDREGADCSLLGTDPDAAWFDMTWPDAAPHHVEQRTVLTFTGSWERSPDHKEQTP